MELNSNYEVHFLSNPWVYFREILTGEKRVIMERLRSQVPATYVFTCNFLFKFLYVGNIIGTSEKNVFLIL